LVNVLRDSFAVLLSQSKKLDRHVGSGLRTNDHTLALDRATWRDRRKIEADCDRGLRLEGISGQQEQPTRADVFGAPNTARSSGDAFHLNHQEDSPAFSPVPLIGVALGDWP
jgi:hypothetical protein